MQLLVDIIPTTKTWQINIPRQLSQMKTKRNISGSDIYHQFSVHFSLSLLFISIWKRLLNLKKNVANPFYSYFLKCKLYIEVQHCTKNTQAKRVPLNQFSQTEYVSHQRPRSAPQGPLLPTCPRLSALLTPNTADALVWLECHANGDLTADAPRGLASFAEHSV